MSAVSQTQIKKPVRSWDKMVHAPFSKVVKFDLACMAMGAVMGIGAGAYLVASGLVG